MLQGGLDVSLQRDSRAGQWHCLILHGEPQLAVKQMTGLMVLRGLLSGLCNSFQPLCWREIHSALWSQYLQEKGDGALRGAVW